MVDFDNLLNTSVLDVFGEEPDDRPTYTVSGGGYSVRFDAVFDDAYLGLMLSDGPEIATIDPVIGARYAQFADGHPRQGGTVTVPRVGKTFRISNVEGDGKGWALLRLVRQSP